MALVIAMFDFFWAIAIVFACCEFCERMSNEFEEIFGKIDQFKWYLFSTEMKQMLSIVLYSAQESIYFACFGSIPSDRETFQKVSSVSKEMGFILVQN